MLKKVDSFGYINVEGKAFYLHWSLSGEWAEISTIRGVMYAKTVVGKFKLNKPQAEYLKADKPQFPVVKDSVKDKLSGIIKASETIPQAAG